jgi:hypothetical protein
VQRDHTETEEAVAGSSVAVSCEQHDSNQGDDRGEALRNADYASLTRRAATDDSRSLVDEVLQQITANEAETRKRQRGSRANACREVVEGFLGDLLAARGEGWVYRTTSHGAFTKGDASPRHVTAVREGLKKLDLLEEIPGEQNGPATRFRATPKLKHLAVQRGIQPSETDKHFALPLPEHPLRCMGASTWMWATRCAAGRWRSTTPPK